MPTTRCEQWPAGLAAGREGIRRTFAFGDGFFEGEEKDVANGHHPWHGQGGHGCGRRLAQAKRIAAAGHGMLIRRICRCVFALGLAAIRHGAVRGVVGMIGNCRSQASELQGKGHRQNQCRLEGVSPVHTSWIPRLSSRRLYVRKWASGGDHLGQQFRCAVVRGRLGPDSVLEPHPEATRGSRCGRAACAKFARPRAAPSR